MGFFKKFFDVLSGGPSFAEIEAQAREINESEAQWKAGQWSAEQREAFSHICFSGRWCGAEKEVLYESLKRTGTPGARRYLAAIKKYPMISAEERRRRQREAFGLLMLGAFGVPLLDKLFGRK